MGVRSDIIANIKTTLEGINGAAPYAMTIQEVADRSRAWSEWAPNTGYPKVCMIDEGERAVWMMGNFAVNYHLSIRLRLFSKGDNATQDMYDLVHDVRIAMFADVTRGNNAINTIEISVSPIDDEYKPEKQADLDMLYEIMYRKYFRP